MRRFALRCDYCGVFHKFEILEGGLPRLEAYSGLIMEIGPEDVQNLNTSGAEESDEAGDPEEAERPV